MHKNSPKQHTELQLTSPCWFYDIALDAWPAKFEVTWHNNEDKYQNPTTKHADILPCLIMTSLMCHLKL